MRPLRGSHLHVLIVGVVALWFAAIPAAQIQPVAWFIFVDDLHLEFRTTGSLRQVIRTVIRTLVRDGDLGAMHATGPSSVKIDPTADRQRLDAVVKNVTGNGMKPSDTIVPDDFPHIQYRTRIALDAAHRAIRTLEAIQRYRRVLIYVSNGYLNLDQSRLMPDRGDLAYEAMRSEVAIYALDPRGFIGPTTEAQLIEPAWNAYLEETRAGLRTIADGVGGFVLTEGDLVHGLQRIDMAVRR